MNAANEIHLVAMLDDAPPPAPNKWGGKGKPDKKTGGKGKGKDGKMGNNTDARCAIRG